MPHPQAQVRNMHTAHDAPFLPGQPDIPGMVASHAAQDFSGAKIASMLARMRNSMCSRPRLVMLVLSLAGLSACAEDPNAHYYHPHSHKGQAAPQWYRPPATPQNSFQYKKSQNYLQKQPNSGVESIQYDR